MALINCPECGKKISEKASCCPECGCPAEEWTIGVGGFVDSSESLDNMKNSGFVSADNVSPEIREDNSQNSDLNEENQSINLQNSSSDLKSEGMREPEYAVLSDDAEDYESDPKTGENSFLASDDLGFAAEVPIKTVPQKRGIVEEIVRKYPRNTRTPMVQELKSLTGIESSEAINIIDTYIEKGVDILGMTKEDLDKSKNFGEMPDANRTAFCRWCGGKVPEDVIFCDLCGKKLKSQANSDGEDVVMAEQAKEVKVNRCNLCGAKIEDNKKICPSCRRSGRTKTKKIVLTVIVSIFYICCVVLGFLNETEIKVSSSISKGLADRPSDTVVDNTLYEQGQPADFNNLQITMQSYEESKNEDYIKPKDGYVFVIVNFKVTNNGTADERVYGASNFSAYFNETEVKHSDRACTYKKDLKKLGGMIAPGESIEGVIGYEVEKNWTELKLEFSDNIFDDNKIQFIINK